MTNLNKYCILKIPKFKLGNSKEIYKVFVVNDMFELSKNEYFLNLHYISNSGQPEIYFTHTCKKEDFVFYSENKQECLDKLDTYNIFM